MWCVLLLSIVVQCFFFFLGATAGVFEKIISGLFYFYFSHVGHFFEECTQTDWKHVFSSLWAGTKAFLTQQCTRVKTAVQFSGDWIFTFDAEQLWTKRPFWYKTENPSNRGKCHLGPQGCLLQVPVILC